MKIFIGSAPLNKDWNSCGRSFFAVLLSHLYLCSRYLSWKLLWGLGFEPEAAEWESQTLPLCCMPPPSATTWTLIEISEIRWKFLWINSTRSNFGQKTFDVGFNQKLDRRWPLLKRFAAIGERLMARFRIIRTRFICNFFCCNSFLPLVWAVVVAQRQSTCIMIQRSWAQIPTRSCTFFY